MLVLKTWETGEVVSVEIRNSSMSAPLLYNKMSLLSHTSVPRQTASEEPSKSKTLFVIRLSSDSHRAGAEHTLGLYRTRTGSTQSSVSAPWAVAALAAPGSRCSDPQVSSVSVPGGRRGTRSETLTLTRPGTRRRALRCSPWRRTAVSESRAGGAREMPRVRAGWGRMHRSCHPPDHPVTVVAP